MISGNNHLGGQDFNNQMQKYLLADIKSIFGKELENSGDVQSVRAAVEAAKLNLTSHDVTTLNITLHSFNHKVYNRKITRKEFESINKVLFDKILEPIKAILDYTELEPSDVDEIVMVGGSTRIPRVRQIISEYFNKSLNTGIDADLAVVSGVAIQAGVIGGMWPLPVSAVEVQTSVKKIVLN